MQIFTGVKRSLKIWELGTQLEIISIEIAGKTAVAKVRDDYLGVTYLDILSFLKIGDNWGIYTKLFHIEG